jgi:hypothetical protein
MGQDAIPLWERNRKEMKIISRDRLARIDAQPSLPFAQPEQLKL